MERRQVALECCGDVRADVSFGCREWRGDPRPGLPQAATLSVVARSLDMFRTGLRRFREVWKRRLVALACAQRDLCQSLVGRFQEAWHLQAWMEESYRLDPT